MRLQLFAGSVVSLGLLLVAAACSTETIIQTVPGDTDAGSSGSSGRSSSGTSGSTSGGEEEEEEEEKKDSGASSSGNPAPGIKSDTLVQGDVLLLGLAGDDAIYVDFGQTGNTIQAVPITGGAPTKVADLGQGDRPSVSGGAVAIWTGVASSTAPRGTLNVWTRATGMKTGVATDSVPGLFVASADGSRIAFSQTATLNGAGDALASTAVGIRDTGADANAATLTGSTAVNLATSTCDPDWAFVGKVFIAAHCTGTATTGATATNAKVLLVPDGATATAARLDAATLATAGTAQPFWIADSTASKVLFIANTNKQARVKTVGGDTVDIDTDVEQAVILNDGSAVIYRKTSGALVKATTAATPATTPLADGVKGVVGLSGDQKQILFHKLDRTAGDPRMDLHVVDHTAATPAPVVVDATKAVVPAGFSGSSSHVLFLGDLTATGASLKSLPVGGGAAKSVASDTVGARALTEGNGAIFLTNPKQVGTPPNQITLFDLSFVDAVAGGQPAKINDSMPQGEFRLKGKRLVYSKLAQQGSGIYAATLP